MVMVVGHRINKLYLGLRVPRYVVCLFFTRFDLLPMNRLLNVWHFIKKKNTRANRKRRVGNKGKPNECQSLIMGHMIRLEFLKIMLQTSFFWNFAYV